MELEHKNQFSKENSYDSSSFKDVLEKYYIHYKWFILSVVILGMIAFFYVRLQVPKYNISATILIKDNQKGSSINDLSGFESIGLIRSGDNSIENEIQILKSRELIRNVVKELQLNIRYFIEESPLDQECYLNSPISLNFKSDSSSIDQIASKFAIRITSKENFDFVDFDENVLKDKTFKEDFEVNLGNELKIDERFVNVVLNKDFDKNLIGKTIIVTIDPISNMVNYYLEQLIIESINDKVSNVLAISIQDNIIPKGVAFIDNLIEHYNVDGINDQNEVSQSTIDFLNERLELISIELMSIESSAQQFKMSKGLIGEADDGANVYLESSSSNERELVTANRQMKLVDYMFEELNQSDDNTLLPVNIGFSDPSIVKLISSYNDLILQRNRIFKNSSLRNPIIINIDSQIYVLKENLISSLNSLKYSSQIEINNLNEQSNVISSKIASVPKNEREYKNIVRELDTKNSLYLFLLQKREESIVSTAIGVEKSKIINAAFGDEIPNSPKKGIIYLTALLIGLIIPGSIIYLIDIFDTKVHDEKDIKITGIPYIGDVPLDKSGKNIFIKEGDNSNIAEAFRYIRTNINFMLDGKERGKTIFVTSTVSGEGKTFTSINLAASLAISGKKTLLLGMDLRASKITQALDLEEILGVTNFIKNEELTLDGITETYTKLEGLHVINSGDLPPNPVELLMNDRVKQLFKEVKEKYEYIVVDTAPVGMVTDTIQIGKYSDLIIYVVKANYLDKRMLHIPEKLNSEQKLANMALLINGSDHSKGTYGYGYGYGYGLENKS